MSGLYFTVDGKKYYSPTGLKYDAVLADQPAESPAPAPTSDPYDAKKFGYAPNTSTDPAGTGTNVSAFKYVGGTPYPRYGDPANSLPQNAGMPQGLNLPAENPLQAAERSYYESLNKQLPDEAAIREETRKRMQAQIDAINQEYQSIFAQNDIDSEDRLGQTRAANSRGGLIGSDFGAANKEKTVAQNLRIKQSIEAEKGLKIAAVFGKIDQMATERIKAQKEEALGNQKAWLDYLGRSVTQAKENVKTLAQGGVSLEELSSEQYQKLLKASGMDEFTFKAYYNAAKPEDQKVNYKYEIKNGKVYGYGPDPKTGQMQFMEQDLPAGFSEALSPATSSKYSEKITPDGTFLLVPDTIDPSKPLDQQILQFGKESQYMKPFASSGGTKITDAEKLRQATADMAQELQYANIGEDGYIHQDDYKEARQAWVQQGYSAEVFDKNFYYLRNPENDQYNVPD